MTSAIILAAGYSSRMGAYKPLLKINGVEALRRVVDAFFGAGNDSILVVTGYAHNRLQALLSDVTEVLNSDYPSGMYSSIKAGISACQFSDKVLITPADCALLTSEVIRAVAEVDAPIVIPRYKGIEGHPVGISSSLFQDILSYDGTGGLRALLSKFNDKITYVDVYDEGCILDMDTPEDYQAMQARFKNNCSVQN